MRCLVVVAHPDDETIWMGGTILRYPQWEWYVLCLSRADDPDRKPRFDRAVQELGAHGFISDLDDNPVLAQLSTDLQEIKDRITAIAVPRPDLVFTHGERGEYTRHERHEQVSRAVHDLTGTGALSGEPVQFAYEDRGGLCVPRPAYYANIGISLTPLEYAEKRRIVTEVYGFGEHSFEAAACGEVEGFRALPGGRAVSSMRLCSRCRDR